MANCKILHYHLFLATISYLYEHTYHYFPNFINHALQQEAVALLRILSCFRNRELQNFISIIIFFGVVAGGLIAN